MKHRILNIVLLLGFILLQACTYVGSENNNIEEKKTFVEQTVKLESLNELIVEGGSINVEINTWDRNELKYDTFQKIAMAYNERQGEALNEKVDLSVEHENNKVTLICGDERHVTNLRQVGSYLRITVPYETEQITLRIGTGKVRFIGAVRGNIKMDVGMANIEMESFRGRILMNASRGNIRIAEGVLSDGSKIKTKMGNINVSAVLQENGCYAFETDIGNIELGFPKDARMCFESIGMIEKNDFENAISKTKASLYCGVGKISISGVDLAD